MMILNSSDSSFKIIISILKMKELQEITVVFR